LQQGAFIGLIENVSDSEKRQLDPNYVNAIAEKQLKSCSPIPISEEKKSFIEEKLKLNVPEQFKDNYLNIWYKNHEAISEQKYNMGKIETLMHDISLKSKEPVYFKRFRIPDAHHQQVKQQVTKWLKPTRSKFNSPIFLVAKKNGGLHLLQDFHDLNAQTHTDQT
jgi:disulfide oxidoreductase YuzD